MIKLDSKFFGDERIRAIRAEFGAAGVLLVIELMNETFDLPTGYWRPWGLVDSRAFAFDHGMDAAELDAMIRRLAEFGIIDADLLELGVLTSAFLEREFIRQRGKARWNRIREHYSFLTADEQIELGLIPAEVDEEGSIPRGEPVELSPSRHYGDDVRLKYRRVRLKSGPKGWAVFRRVVSPPGFTSDPRRSIW